MRGRLIAGKNAWKGLSSTGEALPVDDFDSDQTGVTL
jgi:hypothetical protein